MNLQLKDRVKTSKDAKHVYMVVGFDNPLPLTEGVTKVIVANKKGRLRRLNPLSIVREDGTRIFTQNNTKGKQA